jgi:hypothetical protein
MPPADYIVRIRPALFRTRLGRYKLRIRPPRRGWKTLVLEFQPNGNLRNAKIEVE